MYRTYLTFDDISIIPRVKSSVFSRSEVDLSTSVNGKTRLNSPIVASPMDTVCNARMAAKLNQFGSVGFIHRFQSVDQQVPELKSALDLIIDSDIGNP